MKIIEALIKCKCFLSPSFGKRFTETFLPVSSLLKWKVRDRENRTDRNKEFDVHLSLIQRKNQLHFYIVFVGVMQLVVVKSANSHAKNQST